MSTEVGKRESGGDEEIDSFSARLKILGEVTKASSVTKSSTKLDNKGKSTQPEADTEARWWLTVSINKFRIRALYDTGASCTVMSDIGVQIAEACGRKIERYSGQGARAADGHMTVILGHVSLPFEVAGIRHDIRVAIIPSLDADCFLGTNFMRTFQTIFNPTKAQLLVKEAGKTVNLEVAAVSSTEATDFASIGLVDLCPEKKRDENTSSAKQRSKN